MAFYYYSVTIRTIDTFGISKMILKGSGVSKEILQRYGNFQKIFEGIRYLH